MNKEAFRFRCGIEVTTLDMWLEQRWLVPAANSDRDEAGIAFAEIDVARALFIRDLTGDLGVNDPGIDVILHLVDQLHGLRRALAQVRNESGGEPAKA